MFNIRDIFSFLSDFLSSGIWLEAALLTDSLMSVTKNDQHTEGHTAFLARSGKVTCPVAVTERLVKLLPQPSSALPLVRRIMKAKSKEHFHSSLGVSITTLRVEFKKHIKPARIWFKYTVAWLDQLLNMQHPSGQTFRFI